MSNGTDIFKPPINPQTKKPYGMMTKKYADSFKTWKSQQGGAGKAVWDATKKGYTWVRGKTPSVSGIGQTIKNIPKNIVKAPFQVAGYGVKKIWDAATGTWSVVKSNPKVSIPTAIGVGLYSAITSRRTGQAEEGVLEEYKNIPQLDYSKLLNEPKKSGGNILDNYNRYKKGGIIQHD